MASVSVEHTVKSIISRALEIPVEQVVDDAHLMDDLGADSLDVINIQMMIEDEIGIQVPDEEADGLLVVAVLIRWTEDHLA